MIDFSVIFAGFGGQGILSAGKMAAEAALVISDEAIGSPVVNDADVVICLNQPSMEKFEKQLKSGALMILDSSLIKTRPERTDIKVIAMPASDIASELGKMMFAPITMMGCMATATGCFTRDSFEKSLYEILPERKHGLIPTNMAAFDKGAAFAQ